MAALTYFTVTGAYLTAQGEGPYDTGDPPLIPVSGTVTFTPMISSGDSINADTLDTPTNLALLPVKVPIKNGVITVNGTPGVRLVANTPVLNLTGDLIYRVDYFDSLTARDKKFGLNSFNFVAPTSDVTVDVVEVAPVPGMAATGVTRGPKGDKGDKGDTGPTGPAAPWGSIPGQPAVIGAGSTQAAARSALGASTVGDTLYTAADPATARTAIGGARTNTVGYNPMDSGNPLANAIGDGGDHPLSARFGSLAAAQAVFPFAAALTEQIDESAFTLGWTQADVVLAPPGTYKLKLGLLGLTGKTLSGAGVFKPSADATATALFRANGITGWVVKGVTFDANNAIATSVRLFGGATGFLMEDVTVKGGTDVGINLQTCDHGTFRRVKANNNGTGDVTDAGWYIIATDCDFINCEGSSNTGHGWRFLGASATAARNRFANSHALNNTMHGFYGVGTRSDAPTDYVLTDCDAVGNGSSGLYSGFALHLMNKVRGKGLWAASNTEHGLVLQDQQGARIEVAGTLNGRELVRLQADFSTPEDALSGARQCEVTATAYNNGVGAFAQRGPISIEGSCHDIKIRLIAIGNAGVPVKIPVHAGYADPYNIDIDGQFVGNAGGDDPANDGAGAWWGTYLANGTRKSVGGANSFTETLSNKTLTLPKINTVRDSVNNKNVLDLSTNNNASAVNYLYVANAATGNPARIGAAGTDTNVGVNVTPKGTGLFTVNGVEVVRRTSQTVTTTITLSAGGDFRVLIGAGGAPTLPTAVGNTGRYTFVNIDSVAHTVSTTASQTIAGLSSFTIQPGDAIELVSDNANWVRVS